MKDGLDFKIIVERNLVICKALEFNFDWFKVREENFRDRDVERIQKVAIENWKLQVRMILSFTSNVRIVFLNS